VGRLIYSWVPRGRKAGFSRTVHTHTHTHTQPGSPPWRFNQAKIIFGGTCRRNERLRWKLHKHTAYCTLSQSSFVRKHSVKYERCAGRRGMCYLIVTLLYVYVDLDAIDSVTPAFKKSLFSFPFMSTLEVLLCHMHVSCTWNVVHEKKLYIKTNLQ